MIERSFQSPVDSTALHRFMSKVRKALSHDLRTPLGTIVNFAAVLEEDAGAEDSQVRAVTERIRCNAMNTAEMLHHLLDAMLLAARPPTPMRADPGALLQSLFDEIDGGARVHVAMLPSEDARGIEFDPDLVGFAWRSFLAVEKSARAQLPHDAQLRVARIGNEAVVDLLLGPGSNDAHPAVELGEFLRKGEGKNSTAAGFALSLGKEVLACHGAGLEVFGQPGAGATVSLHLPQTG